MEVGSLGGGTTVAMRNLRTYYTLCCALPKKSITAQMGSDKLNVGSDKTHVGQ